MRLVPIIVCVDDTDDETRSTSTGKVAEMIASRAVELGGRIRLGVTRHQLLLSEDVQYTSHNSSMAFEALVPEEHIETLRADAVEIVTGESVAAADPGLAFAVLPQISTPDAAMERQVESLVAFGRRAKQVYCTKESAYDLAQSIPWISLSEHGGDGQGVVGALAGVGLRLSGSDGRFRGKFNLGRALEGGRSGQGSGAGRRRSEGQDSRTGAGAGRRRSEGRGSRASTSDERRAPSSENGKMAFASVGEIIEKLSKLKTGPVRVVDETGSVLPADALVLCDAEVKAVYLGGSLTIVCQMDGNHAVPLSKDQLSDTGDDEALSRACSSFAWDNDPEECSDELESCRNCLHRRWEPWGFRCMLGTAEGDGE